jgi:hypothetical protein
MHAIDFAGAVGVRLAGLDHGVESGEMALI